MLSKLFWFVLDHSDPLVKPKLSQGMFLPLKVQFVWEIWFLKNHILNVFVKLIS